MKVVSRLLAALMIAGLVLPLVASPLLAAVDINTMSVKPDSSGPVGTEVYLTGEGDDDGNAYVYFELVPDDEEWIQVLSNSSSNWDWEEDEVAPDEWIFYFDTAEFAIPECVGGAHRIAIVDASLGSTADYDDVNNDRVGSFREFTVEPEITMTGDEEGSEGTEVEIEGTGFGYREEITVYFDGDEVDLPTTIKADDVGSWSGKFIVPPASQGAHDITAGGDDTDEDDVNAASFEMTPGISVEPVKGVVGSTFTVKGSGFRESEKNIEILFGTKSVKSGISADSYGIFQATVTVPPAAMGVHEVDAKGQYTTSSSIDNVEFDVEATVISEPLSGNVGTQIEVTGQGLPASTAVTVTYDGVTKGTGTTTADGTLSGITFSATHTQTVHTAEHPVQAMFNNTTIGETFVIESTAPTKPIPRTPLSGARLGVLGKQTPTLTWSVVDDPSGVTYGLQISATPDFSQILISKSGMVAQGSAIIVSSTGPEMSYTLNEVEALPFGTYYWRVKAVDGAINDSGWSASSIFKSGLLPTWALIVIIVLAVVLIGALIYVLVIRDRVGLYD